MKKILLFLPIVFTSILSHAQFVTINESYTTQELLENFFINNASGDIMNISQSTGINFGDINGIAAFNSNGSDFPFESGIVLSSGSVNSVSGPNLNNNSFGTNNWSGDAELENILNEPFSINASYIQFDFVPTINEISFELLFATEEYNQNFECSFSDGVAVILTDNATNLIQNLALLPGTNIPIKATSIHPDVPGTCNAINEEYFEKYNFLPFNNENNSAIDFNGQTVNLSVSGSVVIGNLYTIKIVIADFIDTSLDSSVFLKASSFNFRAELGIDNEDLSNMNIYPNPSTGIINLKSNSFSETTAISIYNLQGQQVISEDKTPVNETIQVDVSNLTTGIYFIKITSEENSVVKRIIKK
ncbi:MAG: choice-of-anchor L domain-containing protein [Flavobacteriaceae bacterium]